MFQIYYPGLKWALLASVFAYGILWLIPRTRPSLDRLSTSFMIYLLTNRILYGISHIQTLFQAPSSLIQGRASYWMILVSLVVGIFWYYYGLRKHKHLIKWIPAAYLGLLILLLFSAGWFKQQRMDAEIPQDRALESLNLEAMRGQTVVLNFWASWCPPCKAEMPDFQRFYENHGEEISIIAVNMTHTEASAYDGQAYMAEMGYTFPILLDTDGQISQAFEIKSIPTTLILDAEGKLLMRREETLSYNFLESLLSIAP